MYACCWARFAHTCIVRMLLCTAEPRCACSLVPVCQSGSSTLDTALLLARYGANPLRCVHAELCAGFA